MDELTTFEGQVAARAFRHSFGRVPRRADEERQRLEAVAEAQGRWRAMRFERRRAGARRTRHAA